MYVEKYTTSDYNVTIVAVKDKRVDSMQIKHDTDRTIMTHARKIQLLLVVYDIIAVNLAFLGALWLRYDCKINTVDYVQLHSWLGFTPIYTVLAILVFWCCNLYGSIWRFASYKELLNGIIATAITFVIQCVGITVLFARMPITYYVFGIVFQFFFTVSIRFMYRLILLLRDIRSKNNAAKKRVLLIGAGSAGQMILRDTVTSSNCDGRVVCIIDDNANKWNRAIDGVPVVGGREDILSAVKAYSIDEIYCAIPSASAEDKREILTICNETDCEVKQLPGVYQLINNSVSVNQLKKVDIEDLLGRDPIKVDMGEVFNFLNGKTVMVTGGGGSIGSELCRQIAAHNPKQLIIFEVYENNAYSIQLELKDKYPKLDLVTLIGSVRDSRRLDQVFEKYHPDIVYHAAAHKHVPLMEDSPCESIKNNAIGTYKTAYAALTHGCKRFVLISTDKAVNPTNIMGASKRLCEMVVQSMDRKIKQHACGELPKLYTHSDTNSKNGIAWNFKNLADNANTDFVAVRFGNVLGSNGSVVPLFQRQIAEGGPVTVTHPDIIRYFMTVQEAVSLVLQAGTYAKGGEIFVLDMGKPVKIDTMARNLIKLSGLKPDVDIKIEYTGLRPGEKLYEEKLMAEEGLSKTANELIHIGKPIAFDENEFLDKMSDLMDVAYANDEEQIRMVVSDMVPTYKYNKQTAQTSV